MKSNKVHRQSPRPLSIDRELHRVPVSVHTFMATGGTLSFKIDEIKLVNGDNTLTIYGVNAVYHHNNNIIVRLREVGDYHDIKGFIDGTAKMKGRFYTVKVLAWAKRGEVDAALTFRLFYPVRST